jgi:RimJ/RimL family protein N-acetyltransferase
MIDQSLIRYAIPESITTARLELRRDVVADAPAVLAAVTASRTELAPWLDWITADYSHSDAVRAQRRAIEYWNDGDSFQWRLWRRDQPTGFVGSIDLHSIDWKVRSAEIGYWLDSRWVGHGYLAEAGPEIVKIGFERLGFGSLAIRCHPDNERSIACARRLGFSSPSFEADGTVRLAIAHRRIPQ